MKNIIFLIARQRTGTTLLRSILDTHPYIKQINELFHENKFPLYKGVTNFEEYLKNNDMVDGIFYSYYKNEILKNENRFPSSMECFRSLLELLKNKYEEPNILIDVKYNSLFSISDYYEYLQNTPLLNEIKNKGYKVIHLIRDNYLDILVSSLILNITNISDIYKDSNIEYEEPKIRIETENLINRFCGYKNEEKLIRNFLSNNGVPHVELVYENLLNQNGKLSVNVVNKICSFLNISSKEISREPIYKKMRTKSLHDIIENYNDVFETLYGTEYERFLVEE